MFDTKITTKQVEAIAAYFTAAKRKADAVAYLDAVGRGARGVCEELDGATKEHLAAVHAAAKAFEGGS